MMLHFAVSLLVLAVVFDVAFACCGRADLQIIAKWNLYMGAGFGALAVLTGFIAYWRIVPAGHTEGAHRWMSLHQWLGVGILIWFGSLAAWKWFLGGALPVQARLPYLIAAVIGVGVLFYQASIGGYLVYEEGVAERRPAGREAPADSVPHRH